MKTAAALVVFFLIVAVFSKETRAEEKVFENPEFDFGVFKPSVAGEFMTRNRVVYCKRMNRKIDCRSACEDHGGRQRRVTCDIFGHTMGNSVCAAHCLFKGHRGGYCDGHAVCNCRN